MTEFEKAKIDENTTEPLEENAAEGRPDEDIREDAPEGCRRRHRKGCHRPEGRPEGGCRKPEGPMHGCHRPEAPMHGCHRPEGGPGFGHAPGFGPGFGPAPGFGPGPEGRPCHGFPGAGERPFPAADRPFSPAGQPCPPMGRPFPPLPDPDSLTGLWIRSHRALERRPADHRGVRRVLRLLDLGGGSLSQRELTELMDVQPGSLSELLGKMEARGLIRRIRSEEDHRRVTVSLTETGSAKAAERGPRDLFAALDEDEKEQLKTLLAKLTAAWEDGAK